MVYNPKWHKSGSFGGLQRRFRRIFREQAVRKRAEDRRVASVEGNFISFLRMLFVVDTPAHCDVGGGSELVYVDLSWTLVFAGLLRTLQDGQIKQAFSDDDALRMTALC